MSSDHWTTIGEIAEVFDGPHATPAKTDRGPYFLSISSLENGALDLSQSAHLSEEDFIKWTRRVTPKVGDVLFSYETRLGNAAMMLPNIKACLGRRMGLLRPKNNKVIPEYLLYAYLAPDFQEIIRSKTIHGATVDRIALKEMPSFPIRIPSIVEQREVVSILKGIDEKLKLNRQTNQTLEQIAQALFKSWFVDFDPVHAKKDGRDTGLPSPIADLFPDEFVESELGMIPKGWEVKSLDEIANFLNGLAMQKFPIENEEEILPVIKIAQLKRGDSEGADLASSKIKPEYIIDDGDVLFSWSGSLEVDIWCGGKGALNQHLFKVTSDSFPKWFYYYWNKHHLEQFQAIASGKAVTMGHIQRKHLTEAKCIVPNTRVVNLLGSQISSILDQQIILRLQVKSLAEIRDSLLPKLLSGEITLDKVSQA